MDGDTLLESVRDDNRTELDRLGSDKALLAATGADLSTDAVLRTVAVTEAGLRDCFEDWAATAEGPVAEAFADEAAAAADRHERVVASLADPPEGGTDPVVAHLQEYDAGIERLGAGLVGQGLVADRHLLQVVNFFVNEADERRADIAREFRTAATDRVETGTDLLESRCENEDDWDRARSAAGATVGVAYDEYVEALEALGVDPKPVC